MRAYTMLPPPNDEVSGRRLVQRLRPSVSMEAPLLVQSVESPEPTCIGDTHRCPASA